MKNEIYFDNSQTTKPSKKVIAAMHPFFTEEWGVFSQPHQKGQELFPAVRRAYESLYRLFSAKEEDTVIFTASGAEAVNQVIQGTYFDITLETGKNHFIVGKTDEAPALMAMHRLEKAGCPVTQITPTVQNVIEAITPRTALAVFSWGNGLTGQVLETEEIAKVLKERGVKFHLDASHVMGKMWVDPLETGATSISMSGDLIHGVKSSGALWVKAKEVVPTLLMGGLEQAGYRGALLDTASLAALGEAASEAIEGLDYMATEVSRLRGKFESLVLKAIPEAKVHFRSDFRLPHISCMSFPGCASEALLYLLNQEGLMASMGGGLQQQIGFVLKAESIPDNEALSALSFSLSRETTDKEVEEAAKIIEKCVKHLKRASGGIDELK
ncbi:MAG: aminotransferase class V-fold PLP-dependent enzyme [Chlamydiia bacterium]|nr:aminotransferase class V-fold PLP-dependent enzyme [Chlamydiia bacterium]